MVVATDTRQSGLLTQLRTKAESGVMSYSFGWESKVKLDPRNPDPQQGFDSGVRIAGSTLTNELRTGWQVNTTASKQHEVSAPLALRPVQRALAFLGIKQLFIGQVIGMSVDSNVQSEKTVAPDFLRRKAATKESFRAAKISEVNIRWQAMAEIEVPIKVFGWQPHFRFSFDGLRLGRQVKEGQVGIRANPNGNITQLNTKTDRLRTSVGARLEWAATDQGETLNVGKPESGQSKANALKKQQLAASTSSSKAQSSTQSTAQTGLAFQPATGSVAPMVFTVSAGSGVIAQRDWTGAVNHYVPLMNIVRNIKQKIQALPNRDKYQPVLALSDAQLAQRIIHFNQGLFTQVQTTSQTKVVAFLAGDTIHTGFALQDGQSRIQPITQLRATNLKLTAELWNKRSEATWRDVVGRDGIDAQGNLHMDKVAKHVVTRTASGVWQGLTDPLNLAWLGVGALQARGLHLLRFVAPEFPRASGILPNGALKFAQASAPLLRRTLPLLMSIPALADSIKKDGGVGSNTLQTVGGLGGGFAALHVSQKLLSRLPTTGKLRPVMWAVQAVGNTLAFAAGTGWGQQLVARLSPSKKA